MAVAFYGDAVVATIEDQCCAGDVAAGGVGHARGLCHGSGEDIVAGLAGVDELFAGSAAAIGGYYNMAQGCHVVDLGLATVFAGMVSGRQQDEVDLVGE